MAWPGIPFAPGGAWLSTLRRWRQLQGSRVGVGKGVDHGLCVRACVVVPPPPPIPTTPPHPLLPRLIPRRCCCCCCRCLQTRQSCTGGISASYRRESCRRKWRSGDRKVQAGLTPGVLHLWVQTGLTPGGCTFGCRLGSPMGGCTLGCGLGSPLLGCGFGFNSGAVHSWVRVGGRVRVADRRSHASFPPGAASRPPTPVAGLPRCHSRLPPPPLPLPLPHPPTPPLLPPPPPPPLLVPTCWSWLGGLPHPPAPCTLHPAPCHCADLLELAGLLPLPALRRLYAFLCIQLSRSFAHAADAHDAFKPVGGRGGGLGGVAWGLAEGCRLLARVAWGGVGVCEIGRASCRERVSSPV